MLCSSALQGDPSFAWKAELEGIFFFPSGQEGRATKMAFITLVILALEERAQYVLQEG